MPTRYSPSFKTNVPLPTSSRIVSRSLRRVRLRTTAVPTDRGTENNTRGGPVDALNDARSGPRRTRTTAETPAIASKRAVEVITLPVGFAPCDDGSESRLVRRACSFWP